MGKSSKRQQEKSLLNEEFHAIKKEILEQGQKVKEIEKDKDNLRQINQSLLGTVKKLQNERKSLACFFQVC